MNRRRFLPDHAESSDGHGNMSLNMDAKFVYRLSFAAGGLLAREAVPVASTYLKVGDWKQTRNVVRERNLIQQRTEASTLRISREVVQRLSTLDRDEVELVSDGTAHERQLMMWSAACRRYELINEFAREVLRERYLLMTPTLTHDDYDSFIRSKALWHGELDALTPLTYKKLRAELFRMLREADLLSETGHIVDAELPGRLGGLLARHGRAAFEIYPMTDVEIDQVMA